MSADPTGAVAVPLDVAALRASEFPWTGETIYLNNASIGPLPERTRLVLEEFNRRRTMPFRLPDRDLFGTMTESRRLVAELLSVTPGVPCISNVRVSVKLPEPSGATFSNMT